MSKKITLNTNSQKKKDRQLSISNFSQISGSLKKIKESFRLGRVLSPKFRIIVAFLLIFMIYLSANIVAIHGYYSSRPDYQLQTQKQLDVLGSLWSPSLKQTNGYTGVLLMGIDSRLLQFTGEEFQGKDRDIDTIIQVIFQHETGKITAVSVPRDTGVTATEACINQSAQYFKSINHLYKLAQDGGCQQGGVAVMQEYVSKVTGFDSHYYAIISYDAFKDIINSVGEEKDGKRGLTIDVARNIYDYYPTEGANSFEAVYFPQGEQFITTDRLLKYVRVRKSSSDFERAARQQQVVARLIEYASNSGELRNPFKLFELYRAFSDNALFSELSVDEMTAGVEMIVNADLQEMKTIVMDDNLNGLNNLLTKPTFSNGLHNRPGWYLSPVHFNDPDCLKLEDEYCKVKEYLAEQVLKN